MRPRIRKVRGVLLKGLMYGYPRCCIRSFLNGRGYWDLTLQERRNHDRSVFGGTGFIPCQQCAQLPEAVILRKIAKKRAEHLPTFPQEE